MLEWIAAGSTLALTMRKRAPKARILLILLTFTIILKALFSGMQFGVDKSFLWLTPAALWGMIFSSVILITFLQLRDKWIYLAAVLSLTGMILLLNIFPKNPYYTATIQEWRHGRLIHFNHLMAWLAWIWPIGALLSMIKGLRRPKSI